MSMKEEDPSDPEFNKTLLKYRTWWPALSFEELIAFHTITNILTFLRNKSSYKRVILYQYLRDEPRKVLEDLFPLLNIDVKHINDALDAIHKDSQNGAAVPRGDVRSCIFSDEEKVKADILYKEFKLDINTSTCEADFEKFFADQGCHMCL